MIFRVPWQPGPEDGWSGQAVISLTDFNVYKPRHVPVAWRTGMRLRRSWPTLPGAIGLWLWALPLQRRSGAVSVWRTEEDMMRFVNWPVHLEVIRVNSDRGRLAVRQLARRAVHEGRRLGGQHAADRGVSAGTARRFPLAPVHWLS